MKYLRCQSKLKALLQFLASATAPAWLLFGVVGLCIGIIVWFALYSNGMMNFLLIHNFGKHIPSVSMINFAAVPGDLMGAFQLISYSSTADAVFKALGVE